MTTTVVAHVPDLMDRSRLAGVAGAAVVFVVDPAELAASAATAAADVVVVDLARPGVMAAVAAGMPCPVVGFGSHVDADLLDAARRAGCDQVLPRSRFFAHVASVLSAAAGPPGATGSAPPA